MNQYAFDVRYRSSRRTARRRSLRPLLTVIFLAGSLWLLVSRLSGPSHDTILSPLPDAEVSASMPAADAVADPPSDILSPAPDTSTGLSETVASALAGTHGTYGIAVKNLKTGESFSMNAGRTFDSASLYKLWVMAVVYENIRDGTLSETQTLSQPVATLNRIFGLDSETAERTEGTVTLTVNDALTKMITVSDNYAAMLLTAQIKLTPVTEFLKRTGMNGSKVGTTTTLPVTTAADTALFFERLYNGQLNTRVYTDKMLALLKDQRLNGKLPKYLPESVTIAHKTGELGSVSHDAGIVYTDNGPYVIVVLTDSNDPEAAVERIANISKNVYEYFSQ